MSINSQKGSPHEATPKAGEAGAAPVLLLLAAVGLLIFLFISTTFDFKDILFNKLFPKPPSHAQEISPSVPDEILLKFKPGVPDEAKENIRNSHGIKKEEVIEKIDVERGKVPPEAKDKIIEALKKNPGVEYAEPNFLRNAILTTPNDTYFPKQWALSNISAPAGWDISTGISSVVIAILDTGINVNHEDLIGKYIGSPTADDNGHGTAVAGFAAASSNNSTGVAGVCWACPILSIKVLDSTGSGSDSTIASGITQAADTSGVKVINLSLGSYASSQTIQNAVNYAWNKGIVIAAGAGNNSTNTLFYPAAYPNVIAVGGTNSSDSLSATSNFGPWVDVFAPGEGVLTTILNGSYNLTSGTSMATPQVAGLAGLILSANPGLTNNQVVEIITSTADVVTAGKRINALKALQAAIATTPAPTPTPSPSDTTPPTVSITNPANNSTVKLGSTVFITASASDNTGISKIEFYVNNSLKCTSAVTPYTCSWKVPGKKNTSYSIQAKAYDGSGNTSSSSAVKPVF